MSRRHSSSRRRNYGRRQHEVRERRPETMRGTDWPGADRADDWQPTDLDDGISGATHADNFDSLGGARP